MSDSRKCCPKCGGEQIKSRVDLPFRIFVMIVGMGISLGIWGIISLIPAARSRAGGLLGDLLLVVPVLAPIFILSLLFKVTPIGTTHPLQCEACGHRWRVPAKDWEEIGSQEAKPLGNTDIVMNEPKWLSDLRQGGQAGDTPAQAKTLSPQEQQEKKAVVDSLIKRIKNI